jgi:hypothetical protein
MVPKGTGFLGSQVNFGSPPVIIVLGRHPGILSFVVGMALRDDYSLEESSTGKALFFRLGIFRLGLLQLDIVPTDDSSLEESSAGACTTFFVDVDVFVVVGGAKFVAAAEFVAAAHADKEGNANVGDIVPTAQVVARGAMTAVVAVGGAVVAVYYDVDVAIVVVDNGDAIAVAVAARVHSVLAALAVAVCGSTGDSTGDSRMVALQRTGRRGSG